MRILKKILVRKCPYCTGTTRSHAFNCPYGKILRCGKAGRRPSRARAVVTGGVQVCHIGMPPRRRLWPEPVHAGASTPLTGTSAAWEAGSIAKFPGTDATSRTRSLNDTRRDIRAHSPGVPRCAASAYHKPGEGTPP